MSRSRQLATTVVIIVRIWVPILVLIPKHGCWRSDNESFNVLVPVAGCWYIPIMPCHGDSRRHYRGVIRSRAGDLRRRHPRFVEPVHQDSDREMGVSSMGTEVSFGRREGGIQTVQTRSSCLIIVKMPGTLCQIHRQTQHRRQTLGKPNGHLRISLPACLVCPFPVSAPAHHQKRQGQVMAG